MEQADPHEMEGLSPAEDTLNITETVVAGEVERSGSSEDENQLKEEALLNALAEIESIMITAELATNASSEQGQVVRSEFEDVSRTHEQRIDETFNGRATPEHSGGGQASCFGEESPQIPEWECGISTEEAPRYGDELGQTDEFAESCQGETGFILVPVEEHGPGFGLQSHIPAETVGLQPEKTEVPTFREGLDTPADVIPPLNNGDSSERSIGLTDLERFGCEDAFHIIAQAFDDQSEDVRNAAARALFELQPDRVASFARMLREGSPDRRRRIGAALAASGLAANAIGNLAGQTREQGYEAFSLLFLMTKAGEVQPLVRAVENHPNVEVRLAVVRLLALNGQHEIVPSFRQLAVRAVLPSEVRTAVIEAIYELGRQIPRDILSGGRVSADTK